MRVSFSTEWALRAREHEKRKKRGATQEKKKALFNLGGGRRGTNSTAVLLSGEKDDGI